MSSTHSARCGRALETSMPHLPRGLNSCEWGTAFPISLPLEIAKASSRPGLALGLCLRVGLGSNRSIWLGPPSMNRWMIDRALAGSCGGLGFQVENVRFGRFSSEPCRSVESSDARAAPWTPSTIRLKTSRREWVGMASILHTMILDFETRSGKRRRVLKILNSLCHNRLPVEYHQTVARCALTKPPQPTLRILRR